MKTNVKCKHTVMGVLLLVLIMMTFSGCNKPKHEANDEYTCPMHPDIVRDKPGNCPVCGMTLVKKKPVEKTSIFPIKPDARVRYAKLTNEGGIAVPSSGTRRVMINVNGVISTDDRNVVAISALYGGRIEKLYLKSDNQEITKGDKIADVYSPDVRAAEQELLFVLKHDQSNDVLIQQSKEKLTVMGFGSNQIQNLCTSGELSDVVTLYSPVSGYNRGNALTTIREGDYVTKGQSLFSIANNKSVWADFQLSPDDAAMVNLNDSISIQRNGTQQILREKIDFLQPFVNAGDAFAKVRVRLQNADNRFRPGEMVTGFVQKQVTDLLWIPRTAIVDLGTKQIVYIKRNSMFKATRIVIGVKTGAEAGIAAGIVRTDSIISSAQFLNESDGFITLQ